MEWEMYDGFEQTGFGRALCSKILVFKCQND